MSLFSHLYTVIKSVLFGKCTSEKKITSRTEGLVWELIHYYNTQVFHHALAVSWGRIFSSHGYSNGSMNCVWAQDLGDKLVIPKSLTYELRHASYAKMI